jgi:hypothetical protein
MAAIATLALAGAAGAVPIVEWDLTSATGQTATAVAFDSNLSATALTPSAGVTPWASTTQDGFVAASNWAAAAPDPTKFYEFSITASAGYVVDYQTISLALFRGIQGGNHGAQSWDLHASTDAFASSDLFLQTFDISGAPADTQTLFGGVDISAIGSVAGQVTFRLYGYDYTAATDFSGLGNDSGWLIYGTGINPVVDGNVFMPVPEPGTALLVFMGLLFLAGNRDRVPIRR